MAQISRKEIEDAFRVLRIEPTDDIDAIKKAHRKMARTVHPDVGGTPEAMTRANNARDTLQEAYENGDLKLYGPVPDIKLESEIPIEKTGAIPGTPQEAFPNFRDIAVVESTGRGYFAIWISSSLVAANISARSAVNMLRTAAGEAADAQETTVWVFVPHKLKIRIPLFALEERLAKIEEGRTPRAPAAPPPEVLPTPDLNGLTAAVAGENWSGQRYVYVLHTTAFRGQPLVRVYTVRRLGRLIEASDKPLYAAVTSTDAALEKLAAAGVNPDIVPVFVWHAAAPQEVLRVGAFGKKSPQGS